MIKMGMRVVWKPEWRDEGDQNYTFVAISDEYDDGRFNYSTIEKGGLMWRTWTTASADMVASAVPLLPVDTFTFLGVDRKGALVQMRRTHGDREVLVKSEIVGRADFKRVFGRRAADCVVGKVLKRGVQFPDEATS